MKLKVDDLIAVHWVDQNSFTETTLAEGSLSEAVGHTVGFFLEQNEEWLCITMERMQMTANGNKPQYRHAVSFPKCCITSIARLSQSSRNK